MWLCFTPSVKNVFLVVLLKKRLNFVFHKKILFHVRSKIKYRRAIFECLFSLRSQASIFNLTLLTADGDFDHLDKEFLSLGKIVL